MPATNNHQQRSAHADLVQCVELDELLALRWQARTLDLSAKRRVLTSLAGGHSSGFRGRGVDFEELRHYSAGDDIRLMDWKVTARSQAPHIRVFKEERERPVWVALDQGSSLQFASQGRFKSVVALQAASLLLWAGLANGDRVGGLSWGGRSALYAAPGHRRESALALLRQWVSAQLEAPNMAPNMDIDANRQVSKSSSNGNDLEQSLRTLRHRARPGSLAFVISDFAEFDQAVERQLTLLQRHVQTVLVVVSDTLEEQPPKPGVYTFATADGGRQTLDLRSAVSRQRYAEVMAARRQPLLRACRSIGIHLLGLSTTDDVAKALRNGLQGDRATTSLAADRKAGVESANA